jgi:hypothetical protein
VWGGAPPLLRAAADILDFGGGGEIKVEKDYSKKRHPEIPDETSKKEKEKRGESVDGRTCLYSNENKKKYANKSWRRLQNKKGVGHWKVMCIG